MEYDPGQRVLNQFLRVVLPRGRAIARNSAYVRRRAFCHFLAERKTCLKY